MLKPIFFFFGRLSVQGSRLHFLRDGSGEAAVPGLDDRRRAGPDIQDARYAERGHVARRDAWRRVPPAAAPQARAPDQQGASARRRRHGLVDQIPSCKFFSFLLNVVQFI